MPLVDQVRAELRAALERDGLTAAALAARLGVDRRYVERALRGGRGANLSLAQLERLAGALGREARVRLVRRQTRDA